MNRGGAYVPPPGPPRDLPHGRTASLQVQIVKAAKEIADRAWWRRLTPDCWHPRVNLLRLDNYVQVRQVLCATARQDRDVHMVQSRPGLRKGVHSSQGLHTNSDFPCTLGHPRDVVQAEVRVMIKN